jgi:hypothetical protein
MRPDSFADQLIRALARDAPPWTGEATRPAGGYLGQLLADRMHRVVGDVQANGPASDQRSTVAEGRPITLPSPSDVPHAERLALRRPRMPWFVVPVAAAAAVALMSGIVAVFGTGRPSQQVGLGPSTTSGSAVATPGGGVIPSAGGSTGVPQAQAAAVNALLDASIASRTKLNAAIDLVNKCILLDKAIADLQEVGTERQSQIDNVTRFDLSAIPEGEQLRSMLKEALGISLTADRSFVSWAQAWQSRGCAVGSGQSFYDEAQAQSKDASDARVRFLDVWNPVASRYGLQSRSSNGI